MGSINLNIHAWQGLELAQEHPDNQQSMTIRVVGVKQELQLYTTLEQWWKLRGVLPRAEGYEYIRTNDSGGRTSDGEEADRWAREHWVAQREKAVKAKEAQLGELTAPPEDDSLPF